jgi:cell wall-active antibiotic response 4TMS protein YvqF
MANESSGPLPTAQGGVPTPPGPNASRFEWRAYRHQARDYYRAQGNAHYGPLAWGGLGALLLILIGVYVLLQNLGVAGWLNVVFWPALLIVLGALLLVTRTLRR